jgi:hypothetical protein
MGTAGRSDSILHLPTSPCHDSHSLGLAARITLSMTEEDTQYEHDLQRPLSVHDTSCQDSEASSYQYPFPSCNVNQELNNEWALDDASNRLALALFLPVACLKLTSTFLRPGITFRSSSGGANATFGTARALVLTQSTIHSNAPNESTPDCSSAGTKNLAYNGKAKALPSHSKKERAPELPGPICLLRKREQT